MQTVVTSLDTLTPTQLRHWLLAKQGPRAIEVFGSWCIYHLITKRKLEQLSRHLGPNVQYACFESSGHEELLHELGITQVPSILYLADTKRLMWQGATDLEIMLEAIHALESGQNSDG